MKLKPAHEKALRATLRVTLFAALGACGGGGGGSPARTETVANSGTATAAGPMSEADCRAALTAAFPNGDPNWYRHDDPTPRVATGTSDADLVTCCDQLQGPAATEDYRQLGCCSTKFDGGHCTPWGPPTPPAMRALA